MSRVRLMRLDAKMYKINSQNRVGAKTGTVNNKKKIIINKIIKVNNKKNTNKRKL